MLNIFNVFYDYITQVLLIDFTNYSGNLPNEFLTLYSYVPIFFKIVVIFFMCYLIFNFIIFLISLGGVRKK